MDAPPQMEMAAEKVAATEEVAEALLLGMSTSKSPSTCRVLPDLRGSQHSAFRIQTRPPHLLEGSDAVRNASTRQQEWHEERKCDPGFIFL
jgi:hypothetical protein